MAKQDNRSLPVFRSKVSRRMGATSVNGVPMVGNVDVDGNLWVLSVGPQETMSFNAPGLGVLATVNTPASTFTVVRAIMASLTAGAAATAQHTVELLVNLSGGGTATLWRQTISAAANTTASINIAPLNIINGAGSTLTLHFLAAPAAGEQQSVAISTYDTG
ncbi:MAG: hypothetical protein KGJ13_05055 [Patescibacteria group bacterium]|nr:hypothetical protein [Patescibacteria group bacterium]